MARVITTSSAFFEVLLMISMCLEMEMCSLHLGQPRGAGSQVLENGAESFGHFEG